MGNPSCPQPLLYPGLCLCGDPNTATIQPGSKPRARRGLASTWSARICKPTSFASIMWGGSPPAKRYGAKEGEGARPPPRSCEAVSLPCSSVLLVVRVPRLDGAAVAEVAHGLAACSAHALDCLVELVRVLLKRGHLRAVLLHHRTLSVRRLRRALDDLGAQCVVLPLQLAQAPLQSRGVVGESRTLRRGAGLGHAGALPVL
mmetsp:Transcript_29069/g.63583  ORF Transcript_29069/g.63583 Transcript_29069/m.63583 type:complete len:202 (-) Transcript_29069:75-680(-)